MWRSAVQVCLGLPSEKTNGGLAQLARAPALQAGGQRFESVILHTDETKVIRSHIKESLKRSMTYWTTKRTLLDNREVYKKNFSEIRKENESKQAKKVNNDL